MKVAKIKIDFFILIWRDSPFSRATIKCNFTVHCRVGIPVIIMGETGCGKTKLIDFMSKLQVPTKLKDSLTTMQIVKVR